MSRKPVVQSLIAVMPITTGSDDELAALDRLCFDNLKLRGRGRRMNSEEISALGELVAQMRRIRDAGGELPRTYLKEENFRRRPFRALLLSKENMVRAQITQQRQHELENGGMPSAEERDAISRAFAYVLKKAAKYL